MKADFFEDIIKKFLDGAATAHEKTMLSNWLKEDPDRQERFYEHVFRRENERPQYLPELGSRIADYEAFLRGEKHRSQLFSSPFVEKGKTAVPYYWAAAIAFLLVVSAGLFSDSILYKKYYSENGAIRTVLLEDGSKVVLNANSLLKVPRAFVEGNGREVWIEGEAFFEVARKQDLRKFIVHSGDVDVQVLGTKFNLNNRRGNTQVTLDEGKVRLVSKENKVLVMEPGEQVHVLGDGAGYEKHLVKPENYTAWKDNKLLFERTPLSEVARIIEDYYGKEVLLRDSLLATREFTGTLPNHDIRVVLMALSTAYNIEIEQLDEQIIIKK